MYQGGTERKLWLIALGSKNFMADNRLGWKAK